MSDQAELPVVQRQLLHQLLRRSATALVAAVLILASCSSSTDTGDAGTADGADDEAGAAEAPTDETDDTDGGGDPVDPGGGQGDEGSTEPRSVPPLVLPSSAPGTDEAARALIDDLDRFITDEQRAAGVPWPDYRNPDPVEVYRSDATFQQWMAENNPTPSLVEAYTAPNSPERDFDLELFDYLHGFDLRSTPSVPPYSMRVDGLVHPAATGITDALLETVPEGSVAVVYFDSVGASDTVTADGQFFSRDEGWTDVGPWVAIMAPTDVGWQVWWDELTEPPPPGSRLDQGAPSEDEPRRDV